MSRREQAMIALVFVLASTQLVGWLLGSPTIRGFGAMTAASPLPFVFTAHGELETFSQRFFIRMRDQRGNTLEREVTPERYAQLGGPYNLRNAYGAVFSHGAVLETAGHRALVHAVLRYGLCGSGPFGALMAPNFSPSQVQIEAKPRQGGPVPWTTTIRCPGEGS